MFINLHTYNLWDTAYVILGGGGIDENRNLKGGGRGFIVPV